MGSESARMIAKRDPSGGAGASRKMWGGAGHGLKLVIALWICATASTAIAQSERILPPVTSEAWQPLHFPRVSAHTVYDVVPTNGSPVLRARSECSASALVLDLMEVNLLQTPRLRWRWRVETGLQIENERQREGDDFAARVYVMFPADPDRTTLWDRLRRSVARRIYGREPPGHAINYVWASAAEPGSSWRSPYAENAHLLALQTGESRDWQVESVDLAADYLRLVGEPLMAPMAIAVMSDSDDSCQQTTAYFADFRLMAGDADPMSTPDRAASEAGDED